MDIRHLRRIDSGEFRQHVLDCAEAHSRTGLRCGRPYRLWTSQPRQQSVAMDFSGDLYGRLLCGLRAWADIDTARQVTFLVDSIIIFRYL